MARLNYRHLEYFREIARAGTLTEAAHRLNLSQSALSTQLKTLEDQLGHPLFERVGRRLELTEVGRIAVDHADRIFQTGDEFLATLSGQGRGAPPLRVGALSTLSRNFQLRFLAPILAEPGLEMVLRSGTEANLIEGLIDLGLDVVLATEPPRRAYRTDVIAHRLDAQTVGLHGLPSKLVHASLRDTLMAEKIILPSESGIRSSFFALCDRLDLRPTIVADVDDMAMVRLLAREGAGLAVAPAVVLADELAANRLQTAPFSLGITEAFFAITVKRSYPHPYLARLLQLSTPQT